jgi:hypothetical protein
MERIKALIMKSSSNPSLPALIYLKGIISERHKANESEKQAT